MMNFGIYNQVLVEWGLFTALLMIPTLIYRKETNLKWVALAIGVFLVQMLLLFFGVEGLYPDLIPGRYNWEGKIAAVLFLLLMGFLMFPKQNKEYGLQLSQEGDAKNAGIYTAIFTAITGAALAYSYFGGVKKGGVSDWLYQLTMPGIHEELFYRGIMLLILEKAFSQKWKFGKVYWSWGAIILTAMFYLTHVIHVGADWNIVVVWGDFLPGVYGLLFMYVRLATGSLLLPLMLHGWVNVIGYVI